MEHLLYNLIDYIGNNMPDIRTIDEDYGQLEMLNDEMNDDYPLVFPAILIDAPQTSWEDIGELGQKGLCSITVRAIARDYAELGDELWKRFHAKDPKDHEWHYRGLAASLSELKGTEAFEEFESLINKVFSHESN
ncbi:MAG: hypothetical protein ACI3ZF_04095 [Candidatus Cryptobacteroides sp.]